MSVEMPVMRMTVGGHFDLDHFNHAHFKTAVDIPPEDITRLRCHIAMMEEVSSFSAMLCNFNKKYIETYPLACGDIVRIWIGRGATKPQIFQGRAEEKDAESTAMEHYLTLKGRCIGEDLFRRLVTETYANRKGEAIVKHLIENYSRLSHTRNGVELIEDTDTTYTELEYDKSKLKDILDFIAKTADKAGVIGFDFRIAYDGRFEFFPRGSKTSPISLDEVIKYSCYRKTIHRRRNRIWVFGAATKTVPGDPANDYWTEELACQDGEWTAEDGTISKDTSEKCRGTASIKLSFSYGIPRAIFTFSEGKEIDLTKLSEFLFCYRGACTGPLGCSLSSTVPIHLSDINGKEIWQTVTVVNDEDWHEVKVSVGKNSPNWTTAAGFDWTKIKRISIYPFLVTGSEGAMGIDWMRFRGARFGVSFPHYQSSSNIPVENITDPNDIREYAETDEELQSEEEVEVRAKALLDWLQDEAEFLTLETEILDFGSNRLQPGDVQPVVLPNENVDDSFRILTVDYELGETQELPIRIELGKERFLLADYLYRLSRETSALARLKAGAS